MEGSLLTSLFLPLALAIIMLGMGLSLTVGDFKRIVLYPRAVLLGVINQLILLPLIGFGLMYFWELKPEYAVGIILLAACPGGPTSNLFAYLGKCDTALSISLTAVSSILTIFTIPFIVNLGMELHMGKGQYVALPIKQTIIQIMGITLVPVSLGMFIRSKKPALTKKVERPLKIASSIFIALIIAGAILKDKENVIPAFTQTGLPALVLNVATLIVGFFTARWSGLSFQQSSTVSIEAGIQNGTLAITIAMSTGLLNNPEVAIPPAVYSILMFFTGAAAVALYHRRNKLVKQKRF